MNVHRGSISIALLCILVLTTSAGRADRTKRSFLNMYSQISHLFEMGYTFGNYLRDYGCWCGVGGSGTPQDNIDRCCKVHDRCYDQNSRDGCSGIHLDDYSYEWTSVSIRCTNSPGSCDYKNCNCDKEFLECLRSAGFPRTFYLDFETTTNVDNYEQSDLTHRMLSHIITAKECCYIFLDSCHALLQIFKNVNWKYNIHMYGQFFMNKLNLSDVISIVEFMEISLKTFCR